MEIRDLANAEVKRSGRGGAGVGGRARRLGVRDRRPGLRRAFGPVRCAAVAADEEASYDWAMNRRFIGFQRQQVRAGAGLRAWPPLVQPDR